MVWNHRGENAGNRADHSTRGHSNLCFKERRSGFDSAGNHHWIYPFLFCRPFYCRRVAYPLPPDRDLPAFYDEIDIRAKIGGVLYPARIPGLFFNLNGFKEESRMLIVGERINTSRKAVHEAVEKRDILFITADVRKQAKAGADYIDVNARSRIGSELKDLQWLVEVVEAAVDVPLAVDSPDPRVLLAMVKKVQKKPRINSHTP